ncbi:MAG: sigma-54-dependent Fis family transcriptional regulator [Melioribacteraceae bacterium]|nr:sigma-54-dependent Fis family transcriptional regulator [Melioribacteraceae bacterium]
MHFGKPVRIMLIEDEDYDVQRVKKTIEPFKGKIQLVSAIPSGNEALELLHENPQSYDVVIMDYQISGGLMGVDLIEKIKEIDPMLQVIVITKLTINISDLNFANDLIEVGAFWYCTKYPGDIEYIYQPTDFALSIFNANEKKKLEQEKSRSRSKLTKNIDDFLSQKKLVGESEIINDLKIRIEKCAKNNASVLITGQSGTGKELVAANIHYKSDRKYENFVPINCGSLPHDLIESELFGYEKGAFTGANKSKKGLFELADGGTIFLDEVAELPLNAQVKLLRVLQEGEIEKIGRTEKLKTDVRIIAATNKDLGKEVMEKRFRQDLYYRINVVPVSVPPLTERKDDIKILAEYFLDNYCYEMKRSRPVLSKEGEKIIREYNWPGNVRELKNVVQRILFDVDDIITEEHVNQSVIKLPVDSISSDTLFEKLLDSKEIVPFQDAKKTFKNKYVKYVRDNSSSDADAAEKLGVAPPNYHRICKEVGIK